MNWLVLVTDIDQFLRACRAYRTFTDSAPSIKITPKTKEAKWGWGPRTQLSSSAGACESVAKPARPPLKKENEMDVFKEKDRVVAIEPVGCAKVSNCKGTVLYVASNGCYVEFDVDIGGHSGGKLFHEKKQQGQRGYCWWVRFESLQLIKGEEIGNEVVPEQDETWVAGKALAQAHLDYILALFEAHSVVYSAESEFDYMSAFIHGYKHGVEDSAGKGVKLAQAHMDYLSLLFEKWVVSREVGHKVGR